LTLIEVVVSIALLSTLLVVMLNTYSAHVRQINLADKKLAACEQLDVLIAGYFEDRLPLPINQEGVLDEAASSIWRSTAVPSQLSNPRWRAQTIRFEAINTQTNQVLAAVELLDKAEPLNQSQVGVSASESETDHSEVGGSIDRLASRPARGGQ